MNTVIGYSDCYLPDNPLTLKEYINILDDSFIKYWGDTFFGSEVSREDLTDIIQNTTKINNVGILKKEDEIEAFKKVFQKYFESGKSPDDIDFIIYTRGDSLIGDINIPYYLQKEFQIKNSQVFCIEQECSATLLAIKLASSLINEGSAHKILILSKNIYESYEKRLMGLFIVSDGVGLMELKNGDKGLSPIDFAAVADGNIGNVKELSYKANQVVDIGTNLLKSIIKKNQLTFDDISLIIPQNTNISGWNIYCQRLGFDISKIYKNNFGGIGHLGDVDMIRNISDIQKDNLLNKDQYALAYALGTGTSWNSMLFKNL